MIATNEKRDTFGEVDGTDATRLALQTGKSAAEIGAGLKAAEERHRVDQERDLVRYPWSSPLAIVTDPIQSAYG